MLQYQICYLIFVLRRSAIFYLSLTMLSESHDRMGVLQSRKNSRKKYVTPLQSRNSNYLPDPILTLVPNPNPNPELVAALQCCAFAMLWLCNSPDRIIATLHDTSWQIFHSQTNFCIFWNKFYVVSSYGVFKINSLKCTTKA